MVPAPPNMPRPTPSGTKYKTREYIAPPRPRQGRQCCFSTIAYEKCSPFILAAISLRDFVPLTKTRPTPRNSHHGLTSTRCLPSRTGNENCSAYCESTAHVCLVSIEMEDWGRCFNHESWFISSMSSWWQAMGRNVVF